MSSTALVVPSLLVESLQDFIASVMVAASLPGGKPAGKHFEKKMEAEGKGIEKGTSSNPLNRWTDKRSIIGSILFYIFLLFGV